MAHPWIFVRQTTCSGDWDSGWETALSGEGQLPQPLEIVHAAGAHEAPSEKLGVLLEDALLFPLRITLEEPAPRAELPRFLAWKLKRYLPFSADAAVIRWVDLPEANTYLTFSLPGGWAEKLVEGFAETGRQCGYIGGAFTTLLENVAGFRGRRAIGLFEDFYVTAALDERGRYTDYRLRRCPISDEHGGLDAETLVTDWQPLAAEADDAILFCDLRPSPTAEPGALMAARGIEIESRETGGDPLTRLTGWMEGVS